MKGRGIWQRTSKGVELGEFNEIILRLVDFSFFLMEKEGVSIEKAHFSAYRIIFNYRHKALTGKTVICWIYEGGSEKRAQDSIRDMIMEFKKYQDKKQESKVIIARVFSGS